MDDAQVDYGHSGGSENNLDGIGSYIVSDHDTDRHEMNMISQHQASNNLNVFNLNAIASMTPSQHNQNYSN